MKYIYTSPDCPKCEALKKKYRDQGVSYEERSADLIKNPGDNIDREALIQASMQNMELPVEVSM